MEDTRGELYNRLIAMLASKNVDIQNCKDDMYVIMSEYEMQPRETLPAILEQDRNEYLIKKFLLAKTIAGLRDRTIKYYKNTLVFVFDKIGKTIDDITTDDLRIYFANRLMIKNLSRVSVQNEMRVMSTFYAWMVADEIILKNPMLKLDKIKTPKSKKEAFTELEIELIRKCLETNRERVIIEVLLSTGCRVSELVSIKRIQIDNEQVLIEGKGGKERFVYLNAKALVAISAYLEEREDDNPYLLAGGKMIDELEKKIKKNQCKDWYKNKDNVSPDRHIDVSSLEQIIRKIGKRSGITTRCYPHKFRRTCATYALKRGMPIEQVSKMLGHESIETTQIYLDLNDDDMWIAHKKFVI